MTQPRRIQQKRVKGWRKPDGAVSVARPHKFSNPFKVGKTQVRVPAHDGTDWEHEGRLHKTSGQKEFYCTGTTHDGAPVGIWHQIEDATHEQCVELYRSYITGSPERLGGDWTPADRTAEIRAELRGKDLMCFCPLDQPCHADVLLEIANQTPTTS